MPRSDVQLLKEPYEELRLDFDFAPLLLAVTDTIVSASLIVEHMDALPVTLVVSPPSFLGARVQATYSVGTSGDKYRVTCRAVDSIGQKHEIEGTLIVMELL